MSKYIDAEKLIAEIERKISVCEKQRADAIEVECYDLADDASARMGELNVVLETITSLQQEQPDFPTTDEEIEIFLATHPKVEVPNKYKTLDWLWKKQEQPEVDLDEETETWISTHIKIENGGIRQVNIDELAKTVKEWGKGIARHFYELGLKAKEENK